MIHAISGLWLLLRNFILSCIFLQKSLEEKIGCLLKFSGDLDDQTCREDLHTLFSNHGEIKWIHFVRGAKEVWRYSYAFYQSIKKPIETFILR